MKKLLFVYNANSGTVNAVLDSLHKSLSPVTYSCNLCALTHGAIGEKKQWRKFRESSGIPMEFLHKNEYEKNYASKFGHKFTYPIILIEDMHQQLQVLFTPEELNGIASLEELIKRLETRIAEV